MRRAELLTGIFVLGGVALAFMIVFMNQGGSFFADELECRAVFSNVGTLKEGGVVKMGGVVVGRVDAVRISAEAPDRVEVRFALFADDSLKLDPASTRAGEKVGLTYVQIATDGLLGEDYLSIARFAPGEEGHQPGEKELSVSEWIEADPGTLTFLARDSKGILSVVDEIKDEYLGPLLNQRDGKVTLILDDVQAITSKMRSDLTSEGGTLDALFTRGQDTLKELQTTLRSARSFLDEDARRLSGTAEEVLAALRDDYRQEVSPRLPRLLDTLQRDLDDVNGLLATTEATVGELRRIVNEAGPRLNQRLDRLDTTLATIERSVQTVGKRADSLLAGLEATLARADPELMESVRRLRRTLYEAELAVRKIRTNPGVVLWGDEDDSLLPREADRRRAREAGRAPLLRTPRPTRER